MMNRYAEQQSGMAPISQSWSKYTKKYLEKGVAFPCLGVALLSFRCRIGGGMRHLKGAIPDKNGSFLWHFTKISNFCFLSSLAEFVAR